MVASSSSRLKPTASSDQQQQQQTGGGGEEEELKLLKQRMSALKLDHHITPVPQTSQVVEGDDQVNLLNQKIAQLKLLPGEEEEVVEETAASSISVDDRKRLLLSLKEVLGERKVRKRLLLLLKKKLQCLRVNVKELKVVDKQHKSMRQCRLLTIKEIVAEAIAIKAVAQRIAVENRRRCHQILDSIESKEKD